MRYYSISIPNRKAFETVENAIGGTLHFELMKRPALPTPEEHAQRVQELAHYIDKEAITV